MWDWANDTVFTVVEWMPELDSALNPVPGAPEFNYFFTLVSIFGVISVGFGLLMKLITRS